MNSLLNIFFYIFIITTIHQNLFISCNICDVCLCEEKLNIGLNVICKNDTRKPMINNLEDIEWPLLNINTNVYLNDINLLVIKILPVDQNIISLNLDNNSIRTIVHDPFRNLKNIESISLVNNKITELPNDFIESLNVLRKLNLSNNLLTDKTFSLNLNKLKIIDLSYNHFLQITPDILNRMENIEILNLEGNKLFVLDSPERKNFTLKQINLSRNRVSSVASIMFEPFKNLETIDLSYNLITDIHNHAFKELNMLKLLNIGFNNIKTVALELPKSIESLSLEANKLNSWPISGHFHENLQYLYLQNNNLREIIIEGSNQLKFLNFSGNQIGVFPLNIDLSSLEVLDLSMNDFARIPDIGSITTTNLKIVIFDSNPINEIKFPNGLSVKKITLNNLSIRTLEEGSFQHFTGIDSENDCITLEISRCPYLSDIHPKAFQNINFCELNLSYNNLTVIPLELTNWTMIKDGIDLQGNPFRCDCSTQWMLDIILNHLYSNPEQQHLLKELRCNEPDPYSGKRFVKYYNRISAFCSPSEPMKISNEIDNVQVASIIDSDDIDIGLPLFIVLIIIACILLVFLIILIIYRIRQYREPYYVRTRN